jgi:hypothetical protein
MPFSDALLSLIPTQAPLSLVGLASVRSSILDFLGQGAGTQPQNIIGNTTLFGQPDAMGVGHTRLELEIATGAAAFVGAGVSLNVQLQYAADLGTPTFQPDTWTTAVETGAIVVGSLAANTLIFKNPLVPPPPGLNRPRFFSLNFVMTGGLFTTGVINYALLTPSRDDLVQKYASKNYTV